MDNQEQLTTSEELKQLENDQVWSLLDEASPKTASPMFTSAVMQKVRAEASDSADNIIAHPSFFKRYSLQVSAAAMAAVAACVMITLKVDSPNSDRFTAKSNLDSEDIEFALMAQELSFDDIEVTTTASESDIEMYAKKLNEISNEDPFIMSVEDIVALTSTK